MASAGGTPSSMVFTGTSRLEYVAVTVSVAESASAPVPTVTRIRYLPGTSGVKVARRPRGEIVLRLLTGRRRSDQRIVVRASRPVTTRDEPASRRTRRPTRAAPRNRRPARLRRRSSSNALRTACARPSRITTRTLTVLRPRRSPFAADSSRRLERSPATRWDSAVFTLLPLRTIDRLDTPDGGTRNRGVTAARVAIGDSRTRRALGYVTVNCDTAFTGTLARRLVASTRSRLTPGRRPSAADSRATSTRPSAGRDETFRPFSRSETRRRLRPTRTRAGTTADRAARKRVVAITEPGPGVTIFNADPAGTWRGASAAAKPSPAEARPSPSATASVAPPTRWRSREMVTLPLPS